MVAYANGNLPAAALGHYRGVTLRRDALAAWIAMDAESVARGWGHIEAVDSYRILGHPGDYGAGRWSQWAAWERYQRGGNLAARPGTSNHGWAIALDVTRHTRWVIDQIGHKYGFAKAWSDAPTEWWHIRWREGVWKPRPKPKPNPLRVLTKQERELVTKLQFHRRGMRREAASGKGPMYLKHLKWARYYKAQIKAQMARIAVAVRKDHGDWKPLHRGARYQVLRKAYTDQL